MGRGEEMLRRSLASDASSFLGERFAPLTSSSTIIRMVSAIIVHCHFLCTSERWVSDKLGLIDRAFDTYCDDVRRDDGRTRATEGTRGQIFSLALGPIKALATHYDFVLSHASACIIPSLGLLTRHRTLRACHYLGSVVLTQNMCHPLLNTSAPLPSLLERAPSAASLCKHHARNAKRLPGSSETSC